MGRIPDEDVQRVRDATDLVALVSETVVLKRKGRLYWGNCPFHSEKTPSFKIDPGTQLWHCFGCGRGGDAFGYVKEAEGLDFPDAVRRLADRAGIEIREVGGGEPRGDRQRLHGACAEAAEFYHRVLVASKEPGSAAAREYLASRGFGIDVARAWSLGWAPGGEALTRHLLAAGYTADELVRADLGVQRGGVRDRFFDRVMFPIRDLNGRTVGFGGRVVGDGQPKYLNSQETPVFHKSRHLYGIDRAKGSIVSGGGTAVVVEGYTDVIALHEAGVANAVATLGTALTPEHMKLLSRFAKTVVYLFDGDDAGVRAALRAADLVDWQAVAGSSGTASLLVALVPGGTDPADYVASAGAEAVRALVAEAAPLIRFVLDRRMAAHDRSTPEGRQAALMAAANALVSLPDSALRRSYVGYVAQELFLDDPDVERALPAARADLGGGPRSDAGDGPAAGERAPLRTEKSDATEREAVRLAATVPEVRPEARELLEDGLLADPRYVTALTAIVEAGGSVGQALYEKVSRSDAEAGQLLSSLLVEEGENDCEQGRYLFREVTRRLKEYAVERLITVKKAGLRALDEVKDKSRYDELFQEIVGLQRQRETLRSSRDTDHGPDLEA